jgi:hypothetical protein
MFWVVFFIRFDILILPPQVLFLNALSTSIKWGRFLCYLKIRGDFWGIF